jgi:hypothetical protein
MLSWILGGLHAVAANRNLTRKSFFIDPSALRRARRILGVGSDAEVVRLSIERVVEQERFWNFMRKSGGRLTSDAFDEV